MTSDPLLPLLLAAREGNDAALTELVRRTQATLWELCRALGHPDDPGDLVQETYERMLRAMHTFEGRSPVRPWLLTIARRVCADAVRRSIRRRRLFDKAVSAFDAGLVSAADRSSMDLLHHLDPDRREAFVLTQLVGLSYEETAIVLSCPIGTVRSRTSRARADLRAAIADADTA
jgi:RNA polymerase sigma-70 factor (ECF subfamily)